MRQPVSLAARRAFWPSRPMASESMRSGTVTEAMRFSSSMSTPTTWAGLSALATKTEASSDQGMTSIFSPPSSATTAWTRPPRWPDRGADRVEPLLAARDGHLAAAAGLAGDGPDLDGAGRISGTSSSKRRRRKFLCVRLT